MSSSSSVLFNAFSNEVSAVFRYFINSRYLNSIGLEKMSEKLHASATDEMEHVQLLVDRIITLGGFVGTGVGFSMPNSKLLNISSADDVKKMLVKDLEIENANASELASYITDLEKDGDFVSSSILRDILNSEVEHIDWISQQLSLIDLVGLPNYLNEHA